MTRSRRAKAGKQPAIRSSWRERVRRLAQYLAITLFGALLGLYGVQWFVGLLPGPTIEATTSGLRGISGNTVGCTYYMLALVTDDPIENVYMKLQLPATINNYRVGLTMDAEIRGSGRIGMQAWESGKNEKGECNVVQAA